MPGKSNEDAERRYSLEWTAAEAAYEKVEEACDPLEILRMLDTIEATFSTKGAIAFLKHYRHTAASLRKELEQKMQRELVGLWKQKDSPEDVRPYIADNWERHGKGWRIPPLVVKSRELLAAAGVRLDEKTVSAWNKAMAQVDLQPQLGWFIGYSPNETPRAILNRARKVLRMEEAYRTGTSLTGPSLLDAVIVTAYCNFDRRYLQAIGHKMLDVIEEAIDEIPGRALK